MIVYIIKTAQNKASIMNSSLGLLLTEEYFTVTGCGGEVEGREDARLRRGEEEWRRVGEERRGGEEEGTRREEERERGQKVEKRRGGEGESRGGEE